MNPSSNEAPGLNLPPPVVEQMPNQASHEVAVNAETQQQAPMAQPAAAMPSIPMPTFQQPQSIQASDDTNTTKSVVPTATTDSDLIDKHIVDKAKAIIEKTKDDPYRQTEQITEFKAEHLRKNYNKTIKTKSGN